MDEVAQLWVAGGAWMYLIALLGLMGAAGALASFAFGVGGDARLAAWVCGGVAALGLFIAGTGYAGLTHSRSVVEQAVATVDPEHRDSIRLAGSSEARVPFIFGLVAALLPATAGLAMLGPALSRSSRRKGVLTGSTFILAAAVASIGVAAIDQQSSLRSGEEAAAHAEPTQRASLLSAARAEAASALGPGLGLSGALFAVGAAMLLAGLARRRE